MDMDMYTHILISTYIQIYIREILCVHTFMSYTYIRLIGSPKVQIIFHKRATKYRSLLQKMTYKDKGSYTHLCHTHILQGGEDS